MVLLYILIVSIAEKALSQNVTVNGGISEYGQELTLFCLVENCCNKSTGWVKLEPELITIFIDSRKITPTNTSKYGSSITPDGFTLVIRNLTTDDLNKKYSCSHGFQRSLEIFLSEENIFKSPILTITGKVSSYGQEVTLFCAVENCCSEKAGWEVWVPLLKTIFIDIRGVNTSDRYRGETSQNGYSLIITNFSKEDINITYSCLYGFKRSEKLTLLKENVCKDNAAVRPDHDKTDVRTTAIIIGSVLAGIVVIGVACFLYLHRKRRRKRRRRSKNEHYSYSQLQANEAGVQAYFNVDPLNVNAEEGETITFFCELIEDNENLQWYREGELLFQSDKHIIEKKGKQHRLTVNFVTLQDKGEYTVKVNNCIRKARLEVEDSFASQTVQKDKECQTEIPSTCQSCLEKEIQIKKLESVLSEYDLTGGSVEKGEEYKTKFKDNMTEVEEQISDNSTDINLATALCAEQQSRHVAEENPQTNLPKEERKNKLQLVDRNTVQEKNSGFVTERLLHKRPLPNINYMTTSANDYSVTNICQGVGKNFKSEMRECAPKINGEDSKFPPHYHSSYVTNMTKSNKEQINIQKHESKNTVKRFQRFKNEKVKFVQRNFSSDPIDSLSEQMSIQIYANQCKSLDAQYATTDNKTNEHVTSTTEQHYVTTKVQMDVSDQGAIKDQQQDIRFKSKGSSPFGGDNKGPINEQQDATHDIQYNCKHEPQHKSVSNCYNKTFVTDNSETQINIVSTIQHDATTKISCNHAVIDSKDDVSSKTKESSFVSLNDSAQILKQNHLTLDTKCPRLQKPPFKSVINCNGFDPRYFNINFTKTKNDTSYILNNGKRYRDNHFADTNSYKDQRYDATSEKMDRACRAQYDVHPRKNLNTAAKYALYDQRKDNQDMDDKQQDSMDQIHSYRQQKPPFKTVVNCNDFDPRYFNINFTKTKKRYK